MQWHDEGIILNQRPWSENYHIISLLTLNYGRHLGLIRPIRQYANRTQLQPGNFVSATWKGRLSEHLGTWKIEVNEATWVRIIDSPKRLAALSSACNLLESALAERHPYPHLYIYFQTFLRNLLNNDEDWSRLYLKFELELLSVLGFGLSLETCAVTKMTKDLSYVSPKTGNAVCEEVGRPYAEHLLKLPNFLINDKASYSMEDLKEAYNLTGYFLIRHVVEGKKLPSIRQQLI